MNITEQRLAVGEPLRYSDDLVVLLSKQGVAAPGAMYEVAENGPETLQVGGRTFLMMGAHGGKVNPSGGGSGTGHTFNVTNRFSSNQPMDGRSQSQMAAAAHAGVTRAASRM